MAPAPLLYLLPQQPLFLKPPAPGIMWAHYNTSVLFEWKFSLSKQPWLWPIYLSRSTVDVSSEYSARPNLTGRAIPRDIPFINRSERSFGVFLRRWRSLQLNILHHNHYLSGQSRIAMAHEMLICATSLARHFHHIPISKVRSMHCWLTQIWFQDIFTSHVRCNPNWADGTNDGVKR